MKFKYIAMKSLSFVHRFELGIISSKSNLEFSRIETPRVPILQNLIWVDLVIPKLHEKKSKI